MESVMVMQGRRIAAEYLDWVSGLLVSNPGWNRARLSRELCVLELAVQCQIAFPDNYA